MLLDFSSQKVLITGATGGIGSAIARAFLQSGATVFLTGTSKEKLENYRNDLISCFAIDESRIHYGVLNMVDKDAIAETLRHANQAMNGLDIVVCNAGITADALSIRMKDADFQKVIDINLSANFSLNREAIKIMLKHKFGRIINVASVVGQTGNIGQANYAASKAGLIGMSKSLAQEVASKNITINCIAPGFIETDMTKSMPQSARDITMTRIPMNKYGVPEDIIGGCLFLASKYASYITGETLNINGGMFMQ